MTTAFAIINAVIFTMDSKNRVIPSGYMLIEDQRIRELGPMAACRLPEAIPRIDFHGEVLMPGLVDSHAHSSLMRGVTENMALMDWLPYYQLEFKAMTPDDAMHAARLTYLEALKAGTTCIMDMYKHMDQCAEVALELGIRANLAPYVTDLPGKDFFATQRGNIDLIDRYHEAGEGRIQVWMGLEHLFYCSENAYHTAVAVARERGLGLHTHCCEQQAEEQGIKELYGRRSIAQLDEYGMLGERTLLAHCVWLKDDEMQRLVDTGTSVAHCPISNAKLASGVARVPEMQTAGITVGLGSDGNVCNNSLDLFEEMKFGSLIQKASLLDPTVMPAETLLRMATIDGARALHLDHEIGSLEPGKRADFIQVSLTEPHMRPVAVDETGGNLLWNLVFAARGSDVRNVWINGRQVLRERCSVNVDETIWMTQAQRCATDLFRRCDALKGQITHVI